MSYTYNDILRLQKESLENKEKYWEDVAEKLVWTKKWTSVFEESESPFGRWFSGGEISPCYNCLDRHVDEGRGERPAIIFDSPVTKTYLVYTYADVLDQVSRLAGVLTSMGVVKGDTVLLMMPMIPEGAFSMLACSRIGACHASITGGLTHPDIAQKIDHCKPKVMLMASHGYHSNGWLNYKSEVDAACQAVENKPQKILVLQREQQAAVSMLPGRDLDWKKEIAKASAVGCTPVGVNDPLVLVYTSGSTGEPKAVVHAGGLMVVRLSHDMQYMLGNRDDVFFSTVNFGWIGGPMLIAYGITLQGSAQVVFEGDCLLSEDPDLLYGALETSKVTRTLIRPGILKSVRGKDAQGTAAAKYDLSRINTMITGGERTDAPTMEWISKTLNSTVWNAYAQTETGGLISGCTYEEENYPNVHDYNLTCPGLIVKVVNVNDEGEMQEAKPFEIGMILIKTGTAPSSFITLLHNREAYLSKYFSEYPGYFNTMDQGCMDEKGHLRIESRADDMMKTGIHYVTSQAIEEIVMDHKAIFQCVVASSTDLVWKEIPVTIFVRKPGNSQSVEEIEKEVHDAVHSVLGSTLHLGHLVEVDKLPITRTGKLHRPSCRAAVRGNDLSGLGALENPEVLPALKAALLQAGYGKDVLHD